MPALKPDRIPPCFASHSLSNVNEVELDLLFTMAFCGSRAFASRMFEKVYGRSNAIDVIGAWRSAWRKLPSGREAQWDVCVLANFGGPAPSLLVIEDKLLAPFQPDQADKYVEFGDLGISEGWWGEYKRCLCASAAYLQACQSAHADWDACVSFEEIQDGFLLEGADPLAQFMAVMFQQAASKATKQKKGAAISTR